MVLAGIAVLVGLVGLMKATQATIGVSLVGFACLLAVVARIQQAAEQRRESRVTVWEGIS